MKKKLLYIILIAVGMFVTACGSDGKVGYPDTDNIATEEQTNTDVNKVVISGNGTDIVIASEGDASPMDASMGDASVKVNK